MILLFFGSFNPVHKGHILVASAALAQYTDSKVWFVLSAQNPFKNRNDLWDYGKRLDLLEKALADEPKMEICRIEDKLPKPSYTIDTLNIITSQYPAEKFLLLMGQDNLQEITMWKDCEKILEQFPVVVYPREGCRTYLSGNIPALPSNAKIIFLDAPLLDYSSTKIRNFVKK
ncbi:MAG: nicotinate (nicotinamide) nucleotide adenylyltransferase [Bacteroidales bacterium]|jgi:nicotinate-nucleotide adenylyltransferase|nr:nicotinate (nicotinamide) nucleotide adenylyltransferase [Bacteroidales bacterium]